MRGAKQQPTNIMKKILFILPLLLICSCRSVEYLPVETVRMDTVYMNKVQRDSIHVRDSIYVRTSGDTVWRDRYHIEFRDRLLRDTIYINSTDTIRLPYPVEARLTRWQSFRMKVGGVALFVLAVIIIGAVVYTVIKLRMKN